MALALTITSYPLCLKTDPPDDVKDAAVEFEFLKIEVEACSQLNH
jgi:hypothetical protein